MDAFDHRVFQFDGFTIDLTRRSLNAGDRNLELRPKSFDVLSCLVEKAGSVVAKDEIISAVWPNVIASDESLAQCVRDIRRTLGSAGPQIIRTVPNRGYQFACVVSRLQMNGPLILPAASVPDVAASGSREESAGRRSQSAEWVRRQSMLLAAAILLLVTTAAVALLWHKSSDLPLPDRPSIAVLPFVNSSGDRQQDYFSDGIAEDLTTSLSKFGELFVIARNSAFAHRDLDVRQIGRNLGVRFVLHGSVRRDGERLRITAQLIDATLGQEMWAETYDRELTGIFSVQDDVTQRIAMMLMGYISKSELDRAARKPPETLAAYDYYLRGKAERWTGTPSAKARLLFRQALGADPRYAPAMAALARNYVTAWLNYPSIDGEYQQPSTLDQAFALASQAVSLDPSLAEAHAELGWILHWQYRRAEALAEFDRALELNPNMADGHLAVMLIHAGRAAESIEFLKRVVRLDPFHLPVYFGYLGNAYFLTGDNQKSLAMHRIASARVPNQAKVHVWHAAAAGRGGLTEEARRAAAEVVRLEPDFTISRFLGLIRLAKQSDADLLADGLRKAGLPD